MDGYASLTGRKGPETAEPLATQSINELWEQYHHHFLDTNELEELQEDMDKTVQPQDEDLFENAKISQNVPTRKQIKIQSAKIVEELSKKDD